MHKQELPLCRCKIQTENVFTPVQQVANTLNAYVKMLAEKGVSTTDILDVHNFANAWFQSMINHNETREWMYNNTDGFNEYHVEMHLPRFRVSFHLVI